MMLETAVRHGRLSIPGSPSFSAIAVTAATWPCGTGLAITGRGRFRSCSFPR
jgi:hypothetical protein